MTRRRRALAVGGAVLAPALIGLAALLLGADMRVDMRNGQPPMVVALPLVVAFALVFALLGWAALAIMERLTARAATVWTVLAVIVLLVSFLPIVAAEASGGTKGALALMHLAVAAVLIPGLRSSGVARTAGRSPERGAYD
ncbi:DUF6069 family protein [Nonomuraea sp. NPDC003804]|uniref:DUF6069 family protein n=1 Tax=Nonomuraea sp. NPDC003804 TaxID=3154547 RepID=UPI0033B95346